MLAGLAITVWAMVSWIWPSVDCRGVEMQPGDVCSYSSRTEVDTERTQSYEERVATARQQAPVGAVVGLGMAGFGLYLIRDGKRVTAGTEGKARD